MSTEWMAQGLCADEHPSVFFPSDGVGVEVARKICAQCQMQAQCLEYALRNRIDHGVWGGTSERQRRRILKQRRLEQATDRPAHAASIDEARRNRDSHSPHIAEAGHAAS